MRMRSSRKQDGNQTCTILYTCMCVVFLARTREQRSKPGMPPKRRKFESTFPAVSEPVSVYAGVFSAALQCVCVMVSLCTGSNKEDHAAGR